MEVGLDGWIEGSTEGCLVEEMDGWRMRWMDREMEDEMDLRLASHERPRGGLLS